MVLEWLIAMGTAAYIFASTALVVAAAYVGSFYNDYAANIWFKIRLFTMGAAQMVLSQDRKWEKQPDPDLIKDANDLQHKQIIFIRHGESDWNEVSSWCPCPRWDCLFWLPYELAAVFVRSG